MRIISEINFFFQAEDGIRDCLLSRGLGDVYKRQSLNLTNQKVRTIYSLTLLKITQSLRNL